MKNEHDPAQLERARIRRQNILDTLNQSESGLTFAQLFDAMPPVDPPYTHVSMRGAITYMLNRCEIAASGTPRERIYIALVASTHIVESAAASRKRLRDDAKKQATSEPWRYIHKPGKYKSQGGQGAVRQPVYVNCQQFY